MQRFGQISLTPHEMEKFLVHLNYPVHPAPPNPNDSWRLSYTFSKSQTLKNKFDYVPHSEQYAVYSHQFNDKIHYFPCSNSSINIDPFDLNYFGFSLIWLKNTMRLHKIAYVHFPSVSEKRHR